MANDSPLAIGRWCTTRLCSSSCQSTTSWPTSGITCILQRAGAVFRQETMMISTVYALKQWLEFRGARLMGNFSACGAKRLHQTHPARWMMIERQQRCLDLSLRLGVRALAGRALWCLLRPVQKMNIYQRSSHKLGWEHWTMYRNRREWCSPRW